MRHSYVYSTKMHINTAEAFAGKIREKSGATQLTNLVLHQTMESDVFRIKIGLISAVITCWCPHSSQYLINGDKRKTPHNYHLPSVNGLFNYHILKLV
jgi:hypothetical protein